MTRRTALAVGASLALSPMAADGAVNDRTLVRRLHERCDRLARRDDFSGVVRLMKGGRVLFERAYGLRNRGENLPNVADTKFNIASVGKMFTSLSVMRFVQAGRLRLDARLIDVWPDYPDRAVAEGVTIAQLLTHSSGLGNQMLFKPKTGFTSASTQTDYARLFSSEGLASEPGQVAYSNDGYVLLGALIERLSGKDFREHCRETIFAPLGMNDTGFAAPDDIVHNQALPYVRDLVRPGVWRAALSTDGLAGGAHGGGYSTVEDMSRFATAMRNDQLLPPDLTREWTMGRVPLRGGEYGYGVQVETLNGERVYGHTGGHYGVAAEVMLFGQSGYSFLLLSNGEVEPYWDLARFVRTEIAGETDASRNYNFTQELLAAISARGVEAGLALAEAHPERRPNEGIIDVYGFRAWHRGDAAAAENLLRFNLQKFPDSLSALWSMAEFYRYARRNGEAIAAYRAYLEASPGDTDALGFIAALGG